MKSSKPHSYILYGWHLSYFAGKVRCYLAYKGIPFVDQPVDFYTLTRRIKRETGEVVMPVLRTPEDEWIQDSSVIIDRMEQRFPERPVVPQSPVQRFASYLFEAWGDEWWMPIAMHTRWSYPENFELFEHDAGSALLPGFPKFMQRMAVARVARLLRSYLPSVGVRPEQFEVMHSWTNQMLDHLDHHFAQLPYLLGGRPTLADYGLVGTMYGHLGRDPWPARELIAPRRSLRAWIDRMANPATEPGKEAAGPLLPGDGVAATLDPVLRSICSEFVPMLEGINAQVKALLHDFPAGKRLPRALGDVEFPLGKGRFRRAALPYTLWMVQRLLDVYRDMPSQDQQKVRDWIRPLGGERLLAMDIPRLRRHGLRVAAE